MLSYVLLTWLFIVAPDASGACSVRELRGSPGYRYRVERIREFLDSAKVIVRARAIGADSTEPRPPTAAIERVGFAVLERLRAPDTLTHLTLPGVLVQRDDFNREGVPYTLVRSAGQRGDCFAREYRQGAEYLLILGLGHNGLTPYWVPLAPLNEQVRGPTDPWVRWVRASLDG